MKTIQERLRDGADICYARNIQLDYARVVTEAADRIDALEAEVAALTKDAERYQWLRMNLDDSIVMYGDIREAQLMGEEDLDAAIDAAMKEARK